MSVGNFRRGVDVQGPAVGDGLRGVGRRRGVSGSVVASDGVDGEDVHGGAWVRHSVAVPVAEVVKGVGTQGGAGGQDLHDSDLKAKKS